MAWKPGGNVPGRRRIRRPGGAGSALKNGKPLKRPPEKRRQKERSTTTQKKSVANEQFDASALARDRRGLIYFLLISCYLLFLPPGCSVFRVQYSFQNEKKRRRCI